MSHNRSENMNALRHPILVFLLLGKKVTLKRNTVMLKNINSPVKMNTSCSILPPTFMKSEKIKANGVLSKATDIQGVETQHNQFPSKC
jgi:hypothetical protein